MLYNRRGVIACSFILSACFLLLISGAVLAAMPVPDGEEFFQYQSITTPFQSDDPAQAKPIGSGAIADGGDTISLLVSSEFAGAVDLYLGIYIPEIDSQNVYLVSETGVQRLAQGLAPWKRGVTSANTDVFGEIPISSLPSGTYTFYLLVTPTGVLDSYYLWATAFSVTPPPSGGMVLVPGGCFQMGDTFGGGSSDEKPVHQVCLSSFSLDSYEVTQAEYQATMGTNPSSFMSCGGNCPVEMVTWFDADSYCRRVGKRLPTEAEWEYAARSGGQNHKYAGTSSDADVGNYAWYLSNSGSITYPVGMKQPNGLGIYDMSGNVWEWVADWYGAYSSTSQSSPAGPANGTYRVIRGGSWGSYAKFLRVSVRGGYYPDFRLGKLGFRCARSH